MRPLLVLFILAFAAAYSGDAFAQAVVPGFGADERPPSGAPFQLPAGIEVAGPLQGADDDGNCPGAQTEAAGSGLWVRACLPLRNMTGGPVTVIFPPGLTIVSASETFQNGLLVERAVVTVPPTEIGGPGRLRDKDEEDDVVQVPLHMYCINPAKDPSDSTASFALGPVVNHPGMGAVYRLLEGKNIANDRDPVEAVQTAVYDIVRDGEISADTQDALKEYVIKRDAN
ncbi:hypothetical protein [Brevundimonas sp. Root1423]|uniref:hypothetical protein n=1 Tax=Brevundimonas sp. Root1423 TaxID=1736462 RepID=UPI0006F5C413|nr:hypothetical protein [Brevundimonas sp. Root1423]KQY89838.1 hypothetical protein ASD25_04725 [Brevundimonas sp. Root1423]